jgi:hypothetical protein
MCPDVHMLPEHYPQVGRWNSAIGGPDYDGCSAVDSISGQDVDDHRRWFPCRWFTCSRCVHSYSHETFQLTQTAFSQAIEQAFAPYIQAFLPFLHPALKAYEDTQLCTVAVGIIGDICRALGDQTAQYASAFVTVLLENLSSDVLNRNVKISIISCFGDIALAIGAQFEPYLETVMGVLQQAAMIQPNPVSCHHYYLESSGVGLKKADESRSWIMTRLIMWRLCGKVFLRHTRVS